MLAPEVPLAIYMEGAAASPFGKMGFGVIRLSANPVVAVVDSAHAGSDMAQVAGMPRPVPIVASVRQAYDLGARAMVLGLAPAGGKIPPDWLPAIDEAVALGMRVINGLHDRLATRYPDARAELVWDVRVEPDGLQPSSGVCARLTNRRIVMVGTDMSVGKMTAGLEIVREARAQGIRAEFVATGQIGIVLSGRGVPLDAVRLDYASGAIERQVLRASEEGAEWVVVEGQGSLAHPASSANLPLLRGAMPTHLVLCARAGQRTIFRHPEVEIPPLSLLIELYESLATMGGAFPQAKVAAVALNTGHLEAAEAQQAVEETENATGLPCADPVRQGASRLVQAISERSSSGR